MGWLKNVFGRPETQVERTPTSASNPPCSLPMALGMSVTCGTRRALEACCRLYESVFGVATVVGPPWLQRALTATWRAQTVRAMLRHGESVDVIETAPGGLELIPVAKFDIRGGPRPDSPGFIPPLWMVRAAR